MVATSWLAERRKTRTACLAELFNSIVLTSQFAAGGVCVAGEPCEVRRGALPAVAAACALALVNAHSARVVALSAHRRQG